MGIGTSLGAYFEDDLDHTMGIRQPDPEVKKPKDTGDDNVLPPNPPYESGGANGGFIEVADKDYDMEGWQKATGLKMLPPGQHYPDTYKLPNHITFSDDSIYHGQNGEEGGHWAKEDGKWNFTPGLTNLKNHSMEELQDYFSRVEPDSTLLPPTASTMARQATGKAVDALKRGQATTPTIDADTGLEGKVYGRLPLGNAITDKDIDVGTGLALGFAGGGVGERVKSAALMHNDVLYEDINHGMALNQILDKHPNASMKEIADGFTTTEGRFISREQAFDLAKKQSQIKDEVLPALTSESKMLLSEDLKSNPNYGSVIMNSK